ncbi:beta-propeller fold lactonase family protein [Geomonas nitrogeniifigens]|uniref:beta-propeller fold lactonase family protein n=1 Tax=Geomonas diazotrophica TaxID=2843197 RepID=UPI001C2CB7C5|nr:beta-propeller fold lactonase family protein [Geomonas nitrogeniifigens]QXE87745.1 beta-propeller fold lactonase family protein [Geomonas nitrogeniifigens]
MTNPYRRNGQQYLYFSQKTGDSVCVMDIGKDRPRLVETIKVGIQPERLVTNRSKTRLYVVNRGSDSISIIDTTTAPMGIIATLSLGAEPYAVSVDPEQTRVFVSCGPMDAGSIKIVDLTVTPPVLRSTTPVRGIVFRGMAVSPDGKRLFVAGGLKDDTINDSLSVYDITGSTPVLIAAVAGQNESPEFVYVNPTGSFAIASFRQGGVNVFDAAATPPVLLSTVGSGEVNGSALSPDGRLLLMGYAEPAGGQGNYAVYDVSTIPLGTGLFFTSAYAPGPMTFSADGARLYMVSGNELVTFDMTMHPPEVANHVTVTGPAGGITI